VSQQLSGHPSGEAGTNGSGRLAPPEPAESWGAEELASTERSLPQAAAGWDANSPARAQRVTQLSAAAACGIALLALAGWLLDVRVLAGQWRGYHPMAPSTALALLFLSGGVFSQARWSTHPLSRRVALAAGSLAAVLGLLVLAQFITGSDWGVEMALARTHELSGRIPLGRMSPSTAAAVLLEGGALLFLLHTTRWRFAAAVATLLALVATVVNLVILLAYSYGVPFSYGGSNIPVAFSTAVAIVLVGVGEIKLTLPGVPALRAWRGDSMRGVLVRAFLPTMLAFILLQGWVEAVSPMGALTKPLWDGITAVVTCVLIVAIIGLVARRIGDTIDRAQEALRDSGAHFRALFDNAPVAYHELDMDGVVRRVNRAECALLGYEASEMLGRPIWEFVAGAQRESIRELYRQKLSGERPLEPTQRLYKRCDGGESWVEIHDARVCDATGETIGMRTLLLDISQRKQAEVALRASEERMRSITDSAQDAILMMDGRGVITYWNPAAESMFGYQSEEAIGEHLDKLLVPERYLEAHRAAFAEFSRTGRGNTVGKTVELAARRKDGREIPVDVSLSAICLNGEWHAVGILRDITERKRMEEAIRTHAEKLARSNTELERFAYVASHDLQEPLRMVASFTQLLSKRYSGKLDATADRYIDFAVDGAKRMQQLIADLLAYSRVNSKEIEVRQANSQALIVTAAKNLRAAIEESGASVDWGQLPDVCVDQTQFIQLFQNLLANAIKFRRKEAAPRIHVSAEDTGGEWLFSVQDNGIGIDPRHADRVFQIFQRLHTRAEYPGTGIGLAVCQKVVERHGGKIWVESEPGAGSTFRFTIPKHGRTE
jgi:PAS domain S-box-containing protein